MNINPDDLLGRDDLLEQSEDPALKTVSNPANFKVTQLCESVVLCEAINGDRYNWGNETDTEPAFLVYLGCSKNEVAGYIQTFQTFYRCEWFGIAKPKHLKEFEAEIKILGMQRHTDSYAFGLDWLVDSQIDHEYGTNFDEYNYHTTGTMPSF